jgi:PadR family transcriptional regulator PadR
MSKKLKPHQFEKNYLGEFEELILLAILRLGDDAYGMRIRHEIQAAGRSASLGAVYTTLDRLEEKRYVSSWVGDSSPERGGRAKKHFKVDGAGLNALRQAVETTTHLSQGLEQILGSAV